MYQQIALSLRKTKPEPYKSPQVARFHAALAQWNEVVTSLCKTLAVTCPDFRAEEFYRLSGYRTPSEW